MTTRYCDDFIRMRLSKGDGELDGHLLLTQPSQPNQGQ
jgi:hypothetical protein